MNDKEYTGTVDSEYQMARDWNNRQDGRMNIRRNRHYGFRVANGPNPTKLCCNSSCSKEVSGKSIIIDGLIYHEGCWPVNNG